MVAGTELKAGQRAFLLDALTLQIRVNPRNCVRASEASECRELALWDAVVRFMGWVRVERTVRQARTAAERRLGVAVEPEAVQELHEGAAAREETEGGGGGGVMWWRVEAGIFRLYVYVPDHVRQILVPDEAQAHVVREDWGGVGD
jgi:hypothetical protein